MVVYARQEVLESRGEGGMVQEGDEIVWWRPCTSCNTSGHPVLSTLVICRGSHQPDNAC